MSDLQRLRSAAGLIAPLLGIGLVLVLAAVTTPSFYSPEVLRLVLFQAGVIGIAAIGQTLVLLLGGIDLSISAVISLTTVILAEVSGGSDDLLLPALLLAFGAAIAVGLVNAGLVVLRAVPPFVATFAMFVLLQGVMVFWTGGAPSGSTPPGLGWLGKGELAGIPVPLLVFAVVAAVAWLVLARSAAGRRVYATGLNPRAAALSGIATGRVTAAAYVVSSLLGVLTGLVNAGYIGYVDSALVRSLDLDSVAASVIGGIALTGGKGRIPQTVIGVLLLSTLLTWLIQLGASGGMRLVVSGAVIILAVWLQHGRLRLRRSSPAPQTN